MEPIQSAMIAVAQIILNGAGQRIGEILTDSMVQKVRGRLKNKNPRTVAQRDEAVSLVTNLITENTEVAEAVNVIASVMENPQLRQKINKIINAKQDDEIEKIIQKSPDNKTLKIAMLGPRGVGKTSTLVAMYEKLHAFQNILKINPVGITKTILQNRLRELKQLIKSPKNNLQATRGETTFTFNVDHDGGKQLVFQDYPGEYLIDPEKQQQVKQYMKQSNVVIIPIDAIALMENNSHWNKYFNKPQDLTNLFKDVYKNIDTPQLIIFTIVKCEKYIKVQNMREDPMELREVFVNQYTDLISFLGDTSRITKIAIVFRPIHTLGCTIIKSIEEVEGKAEYQFFTPQELSQYDISSEYAPKEGDQILKYILRFMHTLYQQKPWYQRDIIPSWLRNNKIQNAVAKFIQENQEVDEWSVLQGGDLLGIK